jgi:Glycosyl transferase family 11
MITVKLLGGLGNQMFQAAFALALKYRGYDVQLNKSAMVEGTHREYSLGYFGIEAVTSSSGPLFYEKGLRYNPDNLSLADPCTAEGYWQSEKYFLSIADHIRYLFQFKNPVSSMPAIAIHVRRQDYVGLQHFHGMPSIDYYREGVKHIYQQVGRHLDVDVFSDDPQWCREHFPSCYNFISGNSKYDDMKLMAAHDYHVIANSSFSWWGAWLGSQKIVVAPKQWFTTPTVDSTDLVPERWVKI